jgi:hypothetical protein
VRALYSECHRRWSVSGQIDPELFASFLPVRPGGGDTPDGQKVHVVFRALRCGELNEGKEALNFTTKIAAEGFRIELGSKDSPDTPASTLSSNAIKRKYEKGVRSLSYEEVILQVMHKVAESMAHEGNPVPGTSEKRSRLGECGTQQARDRGGTRLYKQPSKRYTLA